VWMLVLGFLLVIMKAMEFGPVGNWPWWLVLSPFIAIVIWWEIIEKVFHLREKREAKQLESERKARMDRLYGKDKKK
jgi:small Trp-rich protein